MTKNFSIIFLVIALFFSWCSKEPSKTAQEYWDSAVEKFEDKNFEECIQDYRKIVKYYPQDTLAVNALFEIANVYKNNIGSRDSAIAVYERIAYDYSASEKAPNAMFMIGYIYANEMQDYESAREGYQKFIDTYPNHILATSAKWELDHLGKSLDEIPQLQGVTKGENNRGVQ
jgi:TolA-binding protein